MAKELRYLFFSWPEVVQAVAEYRRKAGRPLPRGSVVRRVLRQQPAIEVDIVVSTEEGTEKVVTVDANELSAALIVFCIDFGVPLPITYAPKSVRVIDKRMTLTVSIGGALDDLENLVLHAAVAG